MKSAQVLGLSVGMTASINKIMDEMKIRSCGNGTVKTNARKGALVRLASENYSELERTIIKLIDKRIKLAGSTHTFLQAPFRQIVTDTYIPNGNLTT